MANPYDDVVASLQPGSAPGAADNPYDAVVGDLQVERQQRTRAVFERALALNPDQEAENRRLADSTGLPPDVVARNRDEVKRKEQARLLDLARLAQASPVLARQLLDPGFTNQAHDDVSTLGQVEQFFRDTGSSMKAGLFNANKGAAGVFRAGFEFVAPVLDPLEPVTAIGGNPLRRLAEGFAAIGDAAGASAKAAAPKTEGNLAGGYHAGVQSLTQNLLALPMAFLPGGQGAALSMMTANTGGQSYQDARAKGLSMSQALPFAASQAAIEYATEKLPLGQLIGDVKAGTGILKTLAKQMALEIPGEQIATVLQDMNEWAVLNPEKPFRDYLAERPDAAAQTLVATIVGTGGNVVVAKGVEAATRKLAGDAYDAGLAEQHAQQLQTALQTAAAAKLRERNPGEFRALVQGMADDTDGAPQEVFVDAEVLNQLAPEVLQQLPESVLAQMADALAANDVVSIPVADVLTVAPGTPLEQALVEHARVGDPMAMTQAEAKAAGEQAQQYLAQEAERVIAQATDAQAMQESSERVKAGIFEQLQAAGRFRRDVNDAYATWTAAFYTTMAGRLGLTPEEMAARYPLRIGGQGAAGGQGDVLNGVEQSGNLNQKDEPRDLVITHNLTAENLLHAVKMGGIPVPSLAVTKKDHPLEGFGEITLIGSQEMADPKGYAGTKVFGADIYSPRYPTVSYQFTPNMQKRAEGQLKAGMAATGVNYIDWSEVEKGPRELERTAPFMWQFLTEKGIAPKVVRVEPKPLPKALAAFADAENFDPFDAARDPVFVEAAYKAFVDEFVANNGEAERADAEARAAEMRARAEETGVDYFVRDYARQANQYRMDRAAAGSVDKQATQYALESQIREADLTADLERHAREFFADIGPNERIFQGYTPSGNRRYTPHTLENVVKILKKELRGGEGFNYGVGSIRAKFTPQFKSIAQIRKAKGRLLDRAGFETVKGEIDAEFDTVRSLLASHHSYGNELRFSDTVTQTMYDSATMGVPRALKENGFDEVPAETQREMAEFLAKLRELPTQYFEAKILRDVDLAEFSGAVVPEGIDPKVIEALQARGVKDIRTYKRGDEADRAAKIGEFENLFFQDARATFNPETLELVLTEKADLSSFLHETGHFFLEVMADLASQVDAPAEIQQDMAALLKWFGVESLEAWNGYDLDQKRKYHERFAESFEQYLLEGKAPSVELQPLFRKFAAWMKHVYRSLKAFIERTPDSGIVLSDEIRQVFDRMLASEEQIAEAEQVAGLLPEVDATAEAVEKLTARSLRDLKWTVNARAKEIKKLQKQAAELRKGIEAEVRAEVEQQPIYKAMRWLKKGETTNEAGEQIKAEKGFRLDLAALAEMYPKTMLARPDLSRLRGMTGKEGLHPDIVADMFGFANGDALVRSLLDAEPIASVIEGMTDRRMLEEHGDLIDERAIAQAANEAVHNEARAKSLATELKAQAEALNPRAETGETNAAGVRVTVNALTEAAKQFAANVVARTPLRDLKNRAWQHTAAERRAAKRWQEHTAKAETQDAVKAKQDQMLNHAAAKAAMDAQAEMRKYIEFFRRVVKDGNEKTVEKGRDPDVVNAARAILAAYGVAPNAGKTALEYLAIVEKNDPAMYAALAPSMQAALAMAQPLDALTMDELRGLHEEIQGMWHLAKRSRQMEVDGNLLDIEDAEAELQGRMQEIGVPDSVPGETGALTKREEFARKLQHARSLLRRTEQWAEGMGKEFTRLVFQPVKDAADRYRADRVKYRKAYQALVDQVAPHMPKGTIAAPELGYTFGQGHNGIGMAELLHAILHTGNDGNKRKLLLGRKWATENADGTLDTTQWDAFVARLIDAGVLKKEHFDFAQGVWDLLEQTKPLAQKTHRDVFGRYFAEVTANAFETPFGTYRGGYVPAQADPRIVQDADLRKLAEAENENMAFAFPATNKGFTKSRTEYNRPLMLDLRTIGQHLDKVLLFAHMEPAVRDVNKLLSRKGVAYSLGRIDPTIYSGMLTPWLNRAAKQIVETPVVGDGGIARVLSVARNRAGMALMFANVSNTLQQLTGFSLAAVKVKPASMLRAATQFVAHPKDTAKTVAEASTFMANRMENEIAAINDAIDEILLDPNLYQKAQAWTQKHAYFLQTAMANTMEPIIWTAAYNDALVEGQSERDAVRHADSVIRTTQGSTLPEDVSRIETGPAYARVFTQFIGYFNMMANTNATALKQIAQETGLKKGAGKALGVVTLGMLIPLWTAEAIAIAMRGGPDDEDRDGYLDDWLAAVLGMGTIKGSLAMVPFVGQLANAAINRANKNPADDKVSLSPAVSLLESAVGVPTDVYKALTDPDKLNKRNAVRDVASAVSLATGLPATAVARPLGYLAGVEDGRIRPTGPVDQVRGLVTGAASPESK